MSWWRNNPPTQIRALPRQVRNARCQEVTVLDESEVAQNS
jgi:hypothetical protein